MANCVGVATPDKPEVDTPETEIPEMEAPDAFGVAVGVGRIS